MGGQPAASRPAPGPAGPSWRLRAAAQAGVLLWSSMMRYMYVQRTMTSLLSSHSGRGLLSRSARSVSASFVHRGRATGAASVPALLCERRPVGAPARCPGRAAHRRGMTVVRSGVAILEQRPPARRGALRAAGRMAAPAQLRRRRSGRRRLRAGCRGPAGVELAQALPAPAAAAGGQPGRGSAAQRGCFPGSARC